MLQSQNCCRGMKYCTLRTPFFTICDMCVVDLTQYDTTVQLTTLAPNCIISATGQEKHQACSYAFVLHLEAMLLPFQPHAQASSAQPSIRVSAVFSAVATAQYPCANMKCTFGASRYSVFADSIAQTIWELSDCGARNSQPPPEAAPAVDFELLDMAADRREIDVAHVSDWVETKINSFCRLAEVHAPDFCALAFGTPLAAHQQCRMGSPN